MTPTPPTSGNLGDIKCKIDVFLKKIFFSTQGHGSDKLSA